MKTIAVVVHKYLPQPDDDLVYYLNTEEKCNIFYIKHHFPDLKDRRSTLEIYSKGLKVKEIKSADYIGLPEPFVYLKELFFTFIWTLKHCKNIDIYIGMDGLCALWGIMLKKMGICKKVIYWSIDFVPLSRFKSVWKNYVYRAVNIFSVRNADEVWDLSPRMLKGRKKYWGIKKSDYKLHKVVPYGVWTDRIEKVPYTMCEKKTLVFMGHLLPKQGVDTVIKKIPEIARIIPGFKFKIIGDGSYKKELTNLVKKMSLQKNCKFLGRLDTDKLEKEIAKSAVAIAPYLKTKDSYTYYADPGKVKTYLACGVPILLTDLPWNAKEIQQKNCGMIIRDDGSDLIEKLVKTMNPVVNKKFRNNAVSYSENYDYRKKFAGLKL